MSHHASAEEHYKSYVKIWATLVILLAISVVGPFIGEAMDMFAITLVTAFGVAIVKALMVMAYFMHLNVELKYIWYLFFSALTALVVLWAGLYPDITAYEGAGTWINCEKNHYEALANEEHGLDRPVRTFCSVKQIL